MHMEWYNLEQVNQWHIHGIIINILNCQIGLHHCNRLVEMFERDISFAYIGVRMREICTGRHMDPVGPTPGHVKTCCFTGTYVPMTPHCDTQGFQLGSLTQMIRSTKLTLVKRQSTWAITSKTAPTIPNDPPWSTYGQTLDKNPSNTLWPPMLRSPKFT
jgi:hypothetical protein